jgi:hypothetical protein
MNSVRSILFVGDLNEGGRSLQRCQTFRALGHDVVALSFVPIPFIAGIDRLSLVSHLLWKLKIPSDPTHVNRHIRVESAMRHFDVVWIEKGVMVRPATLRFIKKYSPGSILVSSSEDDMFARHSRTYWYLKGLKYYDIVFTTKVYNLTELKGLGARRTHLFLDAYDERLHRPVELSRSEESEYACDVGFIGSFENDRAERMLYLAEQGIKVTIYGNGWGGWIGKNPNLVVKNKPIYGEEYVKAINATKINLCFLRKINRDEVTSRSVEIPACGGFMLGERTVRHLEYFDEGKEAEFFNSNEEIITKARFYLENDAARIRVAQAGRERCVNSGYSMRAQLDRMLSVASSQDKTSGHHDILEGSRRYE